MADSNDPVVNDLTFPAPPEAALPRAPRAETLIARVVFALSVALTLFGLDQLTIVMSDFWLLQSLGLEPVFWTNFRMGAALYVGGFLLFLGAVAVPAFLHPLRASTRKLLFQVGMVAGMIGSYNLALHYVDFLAGVKNVDFAGTDPIFGIDHSFYVFELPSLWIAWDYLMAALLAGVVSSVLCALIADREAGSDDRGLRGRIAALASPVTRGLIGATGLMGAVGVWLQRFELLFKDNYDSSIPVGAEYIDLHGLFSNLNYIYVSTLVVAAGTVIVVLLLGALREAAPAPAGGRSRVATLTLALLGLIAFDFAFKVCVEVRDATLVGPNEPVVQLDYIAKHLEATRHAYGLDRVEEVPFLPRRPGDPLPTAEELLASPTLKNAPLWPGYTSYLERYLDPQHGQRILQTRGDDMIYGPTLEVFKQHQKLRTYYNFLAVDNVRYQVDGETRMFVSGVRELPMFEPVPWLSYWGQRYMLFTHGYGLVMAPNSAVSSTGGPEYVSKDIPVETVDPALAVEQPRIYYGEGASTMAFSNVKNMKELDYPSEQGREEIYLPEGETTAFKLDSLLKRAVFGWRSDRFFDLFFSGLITDETRIHYFRQPLQRLARVAPFLYFDSNPYAVAADGKVMWMANAMSTTDAYPYSRRMQLGDKSDERSAFPQDPVWVNYIEDSVKATVDAYTGEVRFYKMTDDPVIQTWANIYPDLFTSADKMPQGVRAQLTYPSHLFHAQFDDLYINYHMNDPMYFFNLEDMWDDGDEVKGPLMDSGKSITFSIEPSNMLLDTRGGVLPESKTPVQYALTMVFTPEKALNLRAIPIAYQDGEDYGKLMVLEVPKGRYVIGPEQADAAIDQNPEIGQRFSWWTRRGVEVVRGHTSLLVVGNEVIYVEPVFLRSQQNPVPELKKVCVVFRGHSFMGDDLESALRGAIEACRAARKAS